MTWFTVGVQLAEGEQKDELPPPNRFSAVIEKIERLYMVQSGFMFIL